MTDRQLAGLPPHPSEEVYESLSARALAKIGHGNDVPRDFRGHMIRFTAPDAFQPRPLYEIFDPELWRANYANGAFFKDKIVLVGPSAQVLHDVVDTPMSPTTPGPTLHLQAMAAALGHEFLRPTPRNIGLALVCAAGLVAWLLVAFVRKPLVCLGGLVAITAGYLVTARLLYDNTGLAAAHRSGAVRARPQRIIFARVRILPRAVGEVAHPAHAGALRLEKSGQRNSRKPGQLLQLASWYARAGDDPVLGLDRFHHAGGESRPRSAGRAAQRISLTDDFGDFQQWRHARQIHRRRNHGCVGQRAQSWHGAGREKLRARGVGNATMR